MKQSVILYFAKIQYNCLYSNPPPRPDAHGHGHAVVLQPPRRNSPCTTHPPLSLTRYSRSWSCSSFPCTRRSIRRIRWWRWCRRPRWGTPPPHLDSSSQRTRRRRGTWSVRGRRWWWAPGPPAKIRNAQRSVLQLINFQIKYDFSPKYDFPLKRNK